MSPNSTMIIYYDEKIYNINVVGKYIFLSLFILASILHLLSLVLCKHKLKAVTKPFLIGSLLGFYLFSIENINWLLFAALIAGFVGDIVLIPRSKKMVPIGGWIFGVEQILLIILISLRIQYTSTLLVWVIVIPLIYTVASLLFMFKVIKKDVKPILFIMASSYMVANGVTSSVALLSLISNPCWQNALIFVGATCFIISDALLLYVRLCNNPKFDKKQIVIMITYIAAQFLITFALI